MRATQWAVRTMDRSMMAAKAAVMATTSAAAGLPLLVVGAIIMLMVSLLMWLITTVAVADDPPARPASSKCPNRPSPRSNGPPNPVGTDFIAVLMRRESGFDPEAYANDSNGGTWGLLQINRSVWRGAGELCGLAWPSDGLGLVHGCWSSNLVVYSW